MTDTTEISQEAAQAMLAALKDAARLMTTHTNSRNGPTIKGCNMALDCIHGAIVFAERGA
jgi:hypothetical protein